MCSGHEGVTAQSNTGSRRKSSLPSTCNYSILLLHSLYKQRKPPFNVVALRHPTYVELAWAIEDVLVVGGNCNKARFAALKLACRYGDLLECK